MAEVSGTIVLAGWQGEVCPATTYVRLLDTGRADAAARTVAEVVFHGVRPEALASTGLPFTLSVTQPDPRARYEVDVLVDLDGDGAISAGDYITTQSYPVLTRGHPDRVAVRVHCVGR